MVTPSLFLQLYLYYVFDLLWKVTGFARHMADISPIYIPSPNLSAYPLHIPTYVTTRAETHEIPIHKHIHRAARKI